MKNKRPRIFKIVSVVMTLAMLALFAFQYNAKAAALSAISDTMSRLNDLGESNHDIRFRTPSGMSASTITINLGTDADFANSATAANYEDIDLQYGSSQAQVNGSCASSCTKATLAAAAGAGAWGATLTGTNNADLTLTYPTSGGTPIATNDYVRILIGTNAIEGATGDATLENSNSTGTKIITINVAGTADTGKFAVDIIDDDQIPVTANVDPTLTFTVANTTLALGTIDPIVSVATSSYNNITVATNAYSGYTITAKDAGNGSNPGLYNTNASKLIASATASLSAGTEGYGGQCNKVSGSGSCTFTGTSDDVTGFTLAGGTFASYGSKPSGTDTFQIRVKGAVSSSTDSGAYADTLTLIATANF